MIRAKRVYEPPAPSDGKRVLIDRLWPRGLSRANARVDDWRRDLAPSDELRRWFGHDPKKFSAFRERYRLELLQHPDSLAQLVMEAEHGRVTLVFAAKEARFCNATVLKELVEENLDRGGGGQPRRRRSPRVVAPAGR